MKSKIILLGLAQIYIIIATVMVTLQFGWLNLLATVGFFIFYGIIIREMYFQYVESYKDIIMEILANIFIGSLMLFVTSAIIDNQWILVSVFGSIAVFSALFELIWIICICKIPKNEIGIIVLSCLLFVTALAVGIIFELTNIMALHILSGVFMYSALMGITFSFIYWLCKPLIKWCLKKK